MFKCMNCLKAKKRGRRFESHTLYVTYCSLFFFIFLILPTSILVARYNKDVICMSPSIYLSTYLPSYLPSISILVCCERIQLCVCVWEYKQPVGWNWKEIIKKLNEGNTLYKSEEIHTDSTHKCTTTIK